MFRASTKGNDRPYGNVKMRLTFWIFWRSAGDNRFPSLAERLAPTHARDVSAIA